MARCFLGGGFNHFLFSTLLGEMIQFDYIIFFSDGLVQPPPIVFVFRIQDFFGGASKKKLPSFFTT